MHILKLTSGQMRALGVILVMAREKRNDIDKKMDTAPESITTQEVILVGYVTHMATGEEFDQVDRMVGEAAALAMEEQLPEDLQGLFGEGK